MASWYELLSVMNSLVVFMAFGVGLLIVVAFAYTVRSMQAISTQFPDNFPQKSHSEWNLAIVRQMIESAPVAIVATDQYGKIKLVNRHLETLFQYHRSELVGQEIELIIPERFRQAHRGYRLTFTQHESSRLMGKGLKLYARKKDGSEFPADIGLSSIMTPDGAWVISFLNDISPMRELESALTSKNEELTIINEELKRRHRELVILGEMGERLLNSNQVHQVFKAIALFFPQLFPGSSGALYLSNSPGKPFKRSNIWGEQPPQDAVLSRDECWGIKQEQMCIYKPGGDLIPCKHISPQAHTGKSACFCLPIRSKDKIAGLIHLRCENFPLEIEELLVNVADQINLTLSNIELQEDLRNQSIRDSLTGLYNRRHLEFSFERELSRAARRNAPVGVIMLDIDYFKDFNDAYGHLVGDEILRLIGDFLQTNLRKEDISCRYGGEEFLIILPDTGTHDCLRISEKLRKGIRKISIKTNEGEISDISLSMGIAVFPDHGKGITELIEAADKALYQAKKGGRGRVVICKPSNLPA